MHRMRNKGGLVLLALLTLALAAATATADSGKTREYVVVYDQGATAAQGRDAVKAAGGTVVSDNAAIGVATVKSKRSDFVALADRQGALDGAAANEAIGKVPQERRAKWSDIEKVQGAQGKAPTAAKARKGAKGITPEPLAGLQWDMKMIGATAEGSYARQQGSKAVRVGVIDTGLDASHPDIAPNFDKSLSRNFTVDDPFIDGACDTDPDKSCQDPANVDEGGHGTHVGGTIAAALNGPGTAGVAPKVDLVNLRAGQDSGYFFIGPVTDALTYAGDHGIDVVDMSFYDDPLPLQLREQPERVGLDPGAEPAEDRRRGHAAGAEVRP